MTRKITLALARIHLGLQTDLALGNLDACRDWGFAGDYVDAMRRMLQQPEGSDYVVATGQSHSVRQFVEAAGRQPSGHATRMARQSRGGRGRRCSHRQRHSAVDPQFYRPAEVDVLHGNASKARKTLGWEPQVSFEQLVEQMVAADLKRIKRDQV